MKKKKLITVELIKTQKYANIYIFPFININFDYELLNIGFLNFYFQFQLNRYKSICRNCDEVVANPSEELFHCGIDF